MSMTPEGALKTGEAFIELCNRMWELHPKSNTAEGEITLEKMMENAAIGGPVVTISQEKVGHAGLMLNDILGEQRLASSQIIRHHFAEHIPGGASFLKQKFYHLTDSTSLLPTPLHSICSAPHLDLRNFVLPNRPSKKNSALHVFSAGLETCPSSNKTQSHSTSPTAAEPTSPIPDTSHFPSPLPEIPARRRRPRSPSPIIPIRGNTFQTSHKKAPSRKPLKESSPPQKSSTSMSKSVSSECSKIPDSVPSWVIPIQSLDITELADISKGLKGNEKIIRMLVLGVE
ncbi:hypothetical protein K435DRAFT_868350 [Dendrothele bispora CBS 962.96]|uniref:Uncharacterized protein n=1 Tax=Dendrothele bispora (strain CBS 962.96) TaxID=1314807 RepID=A0A4V4HDA0_DENBC|nr:hypothetical protein K435DRAFT_868350 [Dendrothele bispora CBS 962.96]